jgi:hypothetical protein
MATNALNLRKGIDVFSSDGGKIGTVGEIFSGEPASDVSGGTRGSNEPMAAPGPDTEETFGSAPVDARSAGLADGPTEGATEGQTAAVGDSSSAGFVGGPSFTGQPYQGVDAGTQSAVSGGGQVSGGIAPVPAGAGQDAVSNTGTTGGALFTPSDTKYFELKTGGVLGLGGHTWYVPFSAVASAAPEAVTLSCTKDECEERYSERPSPLEPSRT